MCLIGTSVLDTKNTVLELLNVLNREAFSICDELDKSYAWMSNP